MENLIAMLNDSARKAGLALPCDAFDQAVQVGSLALSEGRDIETAFEVARRVLLKDLVLAA